MKPVQFQSVPLGSFFKELVDGCWHLKTSANNGMYQSFGTWYQPKFALTEIVFVE